MNAITPMFASAYRQLSPVEKVFVDGYVAALERDANKNNERLANALYRPIAPDTVAASDGLLERPMVLAAISERVMDISAATELTTQRIVKELMSIAFVSMGDYMTIDGYGNPSYDLAKCTPEQLSAIKKITYERNAMGAERLNFEAFDKLKAIEMLGKYIGMFGEDGQQHYRSTQAASATVVDRNATVNDAADQYARLLTGA